MTRTNKNREETMIWSRNFTVDELNSDRLNRNMSKHLDIQIEEITDSELKGSMPVDHRTMQPFNLLHGGASVVLAETLGSVAASLVVDSKKYACVGLEINANHIRGAREGYVYGKTTPLHIGRSTHVWQIQITNEAGKLICTSRITMAVIEKK